MEDELAEVSGADESLAEAEGAQQQGGGGDPLGVVGTVVEPDEEYSSSEEYSGRVFTPRD